MADLGGKERSILLVYEEFPDRTVILLLGREDLKVLGEHLVEALASIHGTYMNSSELTERQEEIHTAVSEAIFGERNEEKREPEPAAWADRIIFRTDEPDLCKEGAPPKFSVGDIASGAVTVIHAGFAL